MALTPEEIEQKVKEILADQLGADLKTITPETRFVEDLSGDSLDCVETIMAFEEEFGIEIPDEDSEKLKTVADAVTYLEGKLK
jgi:acyl carrier protein